MFRRVLPSICVTCTLLLLGCAGSYTTNNGNLTNTNGNANRAATGATTNTAATNTAATNNSTATAPASGEKIGVPECDDFIAKYEACLSGKVPEIVRAQHQANIKQWRDSWRALAANPQTKAALTQTCKSSMESARASMKSYGCEF
jgi:hypothetical protein